MGVRSLLLFFLLFAGAVSAAGLRVRIQPQWGGAPLTVPADVPGVTAAGQSVRVTRLSALLSGFALLHADGSVVQLAGQYGFINAATGRLEVTLTGVPAGDYQGLQLQIGVPAAANHGDPGQWPAGHPLNPLVNEQHWGWQGGYVFLALEGFWRDPAGTASERGFSYHLATDARLMTVRFVAPFQVVGDTAVDLALDVANLFRDLRIAAADGSDTTHSAADDVLATVLAHRVERSLFWLGAKPAPTDPTTAAPTPAPTGRGRLLAFTAPAGFPQAALPADNPLTEEGVELGRRLFRDRRLSGNGEQSCASCHDSRRAFSDRVALSRGATGAVGARNAQPLFNLAWQPAYAWDGTKKHIRDQVLAAMTNPVEMNARLAEVVTDLGDDPGVAEDFTAAFGTPGVTAGRLGLALEQYLLTIVSADSKFDRALRGQAGLTAEEQRGAELFKTEYDPVRGRFGADCFHCHGGSLFSDYVSRSNGLDLVSADAGVQLATGRAADHGRFKTPSLRNVAVTAPYMHDGRFATLDDVVAHYDHGVQRTASLDPNLAKHPAAGLQLNAVDKAALVAFLRTLTDEKFARKN